MTEILWKALSIYSYEYKIAIYNDISSACSPDVLNLCPTINLQKNVLKKLRRNQTNIQHSL